MASAVINPQIDYPLLMACKYDEKMNEADAIIRNFNENWRRINRESGYSRPIPPVWKCGPKLRKAHSDYSLFKSMRDTYMAEAEKAEREFHG